jgi:Uncharacterized conserved protein (COG2071)
MMLAWLKNHPFPVEAFFQYSLVLTFAAPQEQLAHLLPPRLALDTFQDRWGFVAVAMVQTSGLRPRGLPRFMGQDFFLIGYRVFVRYHNLAGKRLRGLYILKSETDQPKMEQLGNLFTHYRYTTVDIEQQEAGQRLSVRSGRGGLDVSVTHGGGEVALPPGSPFANWKEARRFAGPLPFTFSYLSQTNQVLVVEGLREHWVPEPARVDHCQVDFLTTLGPENFVLANAFIVKNIPYWWKSGKLETWRA